MKQIKTFILAIALAFVASGCFEFEQEIYINADGAGRATLRYVIPSNFIQGRQQGIINSDQPIPLTREEIQDFYKDRQGLYIESASAQQSAQFKLIRVALAFDDIEALSERDLKYTRTVEGDEQIVRIHFHKPANAGQRKTNPMAEQLISSLPQSGMKFRLFAPRKLTGSNAESWDANTAYWKVPIGHLLNPDRKGLTLEARYAATGGERFKYWLNNLFK